jgi:Tfp pilus assembly PilM family ATPase
VKGHVDTLGLDIGTVSVKYVRWRGKKGKGIVVSTGEFPYAGEVDELHTVLSDLRAEEGTDFDLAVGITHQEIIKRTFTIPILPKEEVKEAIGWSASKVVSVPLDEMIYEYVMLGQVDERGIKKDEVFFTGLHREYAERLLSMFELAGFKRIVLLTDLAFSFGPSVREDKGRSVAVIDIGGRQTGIYIFGDGKLKLAREIMTASESFTDALMSGLNLSYEEAEAGKVEKGFSDEAWNVLSMPFDRLEGEIHRTFNVYSQKYPESPVSEVYLTGKATKLPHFIERMRGLFGETVDYLRTPPEIEDQFVPAYNLCLETETIINLLPQEIKARKKEDLYKRVIRVGTVAIAAILVFLSIGTLGTLNRVRSDLSMEKGAVENKQQQLKGFETQMGSLTKYNELRALQSQVQKKDVTLVTLLKYLSYNLPDGVYLKEVEFDRATGTTPAAPAGQKTPQGEADTSVKGAVTAAVKETLGETPRKPQGASQPSSQPSPPATPRRDYYVTMRGLVFGEVERTEAALVSLIVSLESSGFLRDVVVLNKTSKEIAGRTVMEFFIGARCLTHEI